MDTGSPHLNPDFKQQPRLDRMLRKHLTCKKSTYLIQRRGNKDGQKWVGVCAS